MYIDENVRKKNVETRVHFALNRSKTIFPEAVFQTLFYISHAMIYFENLLSQKKEIKTRFLYLKRTFFLVSPDESTKNESRKHNQ